MAAVTDDEIKEAINDLVRRLGTEAIQTTSSAMRMLFGFEAFGIYIFVPANEDNAAQEKALGIVSTVQPDDKNELLRVLKAAVRKTEARIAEEEFQQHCARGGHTDKAE